MVKESKKLINRENVQQEMRDIAFDITQLSQTFLKDNDLMEFLDSVNKLMKRRDEISKLVGVALSLEKKEE